MITDFRNNCPVHYVSGGQNGNLGIEIATALEDYTNRHGFTSIYRVEATCL